MDGLIGRVGFEWMDWLNYTGFLGDVCVTFFAWKQRCCGTKPPHERKKPSRLKLCAYQDQLNAGVSNECEIFKLHGIESSKYV